MRVLIFIDNPWQHTLSSPWIKALKILGHEVKVFSQMNEMYSSSAIFNFSAIQRVCLWNLREKGPWGFLKRIPIYALSPLLQKAQNAMNQALEEAIKEYRPALVIVLKGLGIYPETLDRLRSQSDCALVNFNGDDPRNLYSSNSNVLDALAFYDCVFTWSRRLVPVLLKAGARRAEYLPFGCDHDVHKETTITTVDRNRYGSDITFIGTWDRERHRRLENLMDLNLGIWGSHWNRLPQKFTFAKCIRGGQVDMPIMRKIYRSSKVSLNLMRPQNDSSHNMKTFEIPAMGGFMLAPRTMEHMEIFEEGKEVVFYDTPEEMREKAIYYTENDKERAAMARLAHQKVISNHTYTNRMRQLIAHLEL